MDNNTEMESPKIYDVGSYHGVKNYLKQVEKNSANYVSEENVRLWMDFYNKLSRFQRQKKPYYAMKKLLDKKINEQFSESIILKTLHQEVEKDRKRSYQIEMHTFEKVDLKDFQVGIYYDAPGRPALQHHITDIMISEREYSEKTHGTSLIFVPHALERFYERENIKMNEIGSKISNWFYDYYKASAFVMAAGISTGKFPTPVATLTKALKDVRPTTAIPCGNGMMIVEICPSLIKKALLRFLLRSGRPEVIDSAFVPKMYRKLEDFSGGEQIASHIKCLAVTYISPDIFRPAQREYCDIIKQEIMKNEYEQNPQIMFSLWPEEGIEELVTNIESDVITRLKELLPSVVSCRYPEGSPWLVI